MRAHVGDQLIVRSHHVGEPDRHGEVLEAHGPDSTQPFVVRWDDTGHTTLFFPGTDCFVQHLAHCPSDAPPCAPTQAEISTTR